MYFVSVLKNDNDGEDDVGDEDDDDNYDD